MKSIANAVRRGVASPARITCALATVGLLSATVPVAVGAAPAQAQPGAMHEPTSGVVTSRIDQRCRSGADNHDGIDLADPTGTPVFAAYRGTVTFAGTMSGYGRIVIISHPSGYQTRYAHLAGFRVRVNQRVVREERIGRMGASGNATGPHLHFEVRRNGAVHTPINAAYSCGERITAQRRIPARFPGLPT
jgi:murein DD-endopeptidase MepM/ murein hydrolase activator NlpD